MLTEPEHGDSSAEGRSYVCLENGEYHACLNREAAIELLDCLRWHAHEAPPDEEVSISSDE